MLSLKINLSRPEYIFVTLVELMIYFERYEKIECAILYFFFLPVTQENGQTSRRSNDIPTRVAPR